MNTPASGLEPISLEAAKQRRRDQAFVEGWIARTVRRYNVDRRAPIYQDLRAAGTLGALQGEADWDALPPEEQTDENRRKMVARSIRNHVRSAWHDIVGKTKHKRAAALDAATGIGEYARTPLIARLRDMRGHLNHEVVAGRFHGSLGMESPEDAYIERERQQLDRDRILFALAKLEDPIESMVARRLYEGATLMAACAEVGVYEKSQRTRIRERVVKKLRRHAVVFASSRGPRRRAPRDKGDAPA